MEKEFVPYELALRMKTLGFNENCFRVGNPNGVIFWRFMDVAGVEGVGIDDILLEKFDKLWWVEIPTYSQAFRWFREKHNIDGLLHKTAEGSYYFWITECEYENYNHYKYYNQMVYFNTYEEAELACLQKLIEIIESKNK